MFRPLPAFARYDRTTAGDPDDPTKLAKAILKLKDKKLRYKLGLNGYKKVKKEFSVKKMYLETKKIYSLNEKNI